MNDPARDCENCKYLSLTVLDHPCCDCYRGGRGYVWSCGGADMWEGEE
jgi:hypothetical protein